VQYKSTAKKDSWDDSQKELQKAWIRKFRSNSDTCSEYATRIRCGSCGHDFRSNTQKAESSPTGKYRYWRCPVCKNMVGLREDFLDKYSDEILGVSGHTKNEFREQIEFIERTGPDEVVYHMINGKTIKHSWPLQYPKPKRKNKEVKQQCQE